MSQYIRILNHLKGNIGSLPPTPSQEACRIAIMDRMAYPGVINLYGATGTGKTVLGWMMAALGNVAYFVHADHITSPASRSAPIAFIDNAPRERSNFRHLLARLESAGIDRSVIVTRYPADDYIFRTELELTPEDMAIVRKSLARFGYSCQANADAMNLWHLMTHTIGEMK
jgi:hypothetical protein